MTPLVLVRRVRRAFWRDDRGAAVVEFALVLPILVLLVMVFIDATRGFYTVNSLVAAAREGARFGSAQNLTCPGPTETEANRIRDRVIESAVLFGGAQLERRMVQVTLASSGGGACENVRVRVQDYPFRPLTPIVAAIGADSILITREAIFRWERAP